MGLKANIKFKQVTMKEKELNTALREFMKDLLDNAAAAFVHAMLRRIPVYTGMSAASVQPLARYLNTRDIKNQINENVKGRVDPIKGKDYTRSVPAGIAAGTFNMLYGPRYYAMTFTSDVPHFGINDKNDMSSKMPRLIHKTPWDSQIAGYIAFDDYLKANFSNLGGLDFDSFVKIT